jgi:hypothetical protein
MVSNVYGIDNTDETVGYYKSKGGTVKKNLKSIDFSGGKSQVMDSDLQYLKFFPNLEVLHLSGQSISDEGIIFIKNHNSLRVLSLDNTR